MPIIPGSITPIRDNENPIDPAAMLAGLDIV